MKLKKNVFLLTLSICLLMVIYILSAARPLGKELLITPEWTINIGRAPEGSSPQSSLQLPFRLGQVMGYFTADGKITLATTFPYKATISSHYYAQYGSDNPETAFFNTDGTQAGTITYNGFPFFDDDRIFTFLPGGSSFIQCKPDGSESWSYEGVMPITAFSSSPSGCVAGFADGTIRTFSSDGRILQEFSPGGSDFSVILGTDLSSDGKYLACISGLNRQRIVLAKCDKEHCTITFFKYFDKNLTRQTLVKFSKKSDVLYYNYAGGLGIVNCASGSHTEMPVKGKIITIQESDIGNTVYVLGKNDNEYSVYIIEEFDNMVGSFSFTADNAFILTSGNSLFVGRDSQISRLTLSKK
jgi:hypothetical protein